MKSQWSFSFMVNFCVLLEKHMLISKRHTVLEQKSHFLIARLVISSLHHGVNLPMGVLCSLSRPTQMNLTCRGFFRDPWNTVIAGSTFQSLVSRRLGVVPWQLGIPAMGRVPVQVSGLWMPAATFFLPEESFQCRRSKMTTWLSPLPVLFPTVSTVSSNTW